MFNESKQDNIYICFEIRKIFIEYYELVKERFWNLVKFTIKNDAISYFERDEFAFLLDQIIKRFIYNNKDLSNIEKLAYITKYNPCCKEEKYFNRVDSDILDFFDINNIDKNFIKDFRRMNFSNIFKKNIYEYINKIISKIKDISNFDSIIKLININKIDDKNIFLDSLKKKYENIIKNQIGLLTNNEEKLKVIKVVAKLAFINFIYELDDKRFDFIKKK